MNAGQAGLRSPGAPTPRQAAAALSLLPEPLRRRALHALPQCSAKTRVRKLPLVIHVDPMRLVAVQKTCRYHPSRARLLAHQDAFEA